MKVLINIGLLIILTYNCISAQLIFKKDGREIFLFLDEGAAFFKGDCIERQSGQIENGEIAFKEDGNKKLWTKSNEDVHLAMDLIEGSSIDRSGLKFSNNSTSLGAVSNSNGDLYTSDYKFKLFVESIRFNWETNNGNEDALNIRKDADNAINLPEYQRGSVNDEVAYLGGKTVKMNVKFRVEPTSITSLWIEGVSNDENGMLGNTYQTEVTFNNGLSNEVQFEIVEAIPNVIQKSAEFWEWSVIKGDISLVTDVTGPHTMYTILGTPQSPWNNVYNNDQNPWVIALDLVIDVEKGGAHGSTSLTDAADVITTYLHGGHGYSYDTWSGAGRYKTGTGSSFNLTGYINKSLGTIINCYDMGGGVNVLTALVGNPSRYLYMGPFGYLHPLYLVGVQDLCNNPFFNNQSPPYNVPLVGLDDANRTSFGNHAFVELNGLIYDGCGGPYLGLGNRQEYINQNIDKSTSSEASRGGDLGDINIYPITGLY